MHPLPAPRAQCLFLRSFAPAAWPPSASPSRLPRRPPPSFPARRPLFPPRCSAVLFSLSSARPRHDPSSPATSAAHSGSTPSALPHLPLPSSPRNPPPSGRVSRVFRRSWLFLKIALAGGLGYAALQVYLLKNPRDQAEPDPEKKTLVILGTGWGSVSLLKNLDTSLYNVVVISPRNYFLFTPLLPSCTTGQIEHRSIMEPVRSFLRHKKTAVKFYEAEATKIDYANKTVHMIDESEIKGDVHKTEIPFDMLVVGVGAEQATFGIPGVREHALYLKEVSDAQQIRRRIMDCCETASFKDQDESEVRRLLHMVVVGGGPTGVEFAGELHDFFQQDLRKWLPDIEQNFRVTLVEALPSVLHSFSKQLIDYTEKTFKESAIDIRTQTTVRGVHERYIEAESVGPDGRRAVEKIPYGLLVWATGNAVRPVVRDLMDQLPAQKDGRRGLLVNEYLVVKGTEDVWAVGDCAIANYAPTAQVASQEGSFLAQLFNQMGQKDQAEAEVWAARAQLAAVEAADAQGATAAAVAGGDDNRASSSTSSTSSSPATATATATAMAMTREEAEARVHEAERRERRVGQRLVGPFEYSHQGSLAYIGSEKAVADISWMTGNVALGGRITYYFWRSAYLSMCFSIRNRILVMIDWMKTKAFGRDVSRE